MAYIYYKRLPNAKTLASALLKHYGYNLQYGVYLQERAGLSRSVRVEQIKNKSKILKFIELTMKRMSANRRTGKHLRLLNSHRISFIKSNGSYKGLRMRQLLPCRGQRTKTNARTSKRRPITL